MSPVAHAMRSDAESSSVIRRRVVIGLLLVAAMVLLVAAVAVVSEGVGGSSQTLIYHTVTRSDLAINVTERGNLESQNDVEVFCEVDDIDGDGIRGTPILWIVPNGSSVKEGDLLVELESSNHTERLDRQILDTERARSEQIQARVKFENQKTQNETQLAEARLKLDLARLALKQFEDDEGGTFQIDLQDIELQIQEAQAGKLIEEKNLEGVKQLHRLGYRSRGELAQAELSALKSERQLAKAISLKKELVEYQYLKTKLELEGQVASAERNLKQVERDNEAALEQARAAMEAADESLKKEEERLARYREQLAKCKIYAPQDGMVAYAVADGWRREEIREGATVRPRQAILTLPNLSRMQVKTAVHESVLDQIESGLPATVRVDAFPDKTYRGTVQSVAVLPDQDSWMSSDTKVYETVVTVDEEVEQLKPGMTAVVEIHVAELTDVLSVPVQAIVQVKNESWCYVGVNGGVERRTLELGRTNDKFVEIRKGLTEGDRVVLNPMAIVDEAKEREKAEREEESEAPEEEERGSPRRPPAGAEPAPGGERPSGGRSRGPGPGLGDGDGEPAL